MIRSLQIFRDLTHSYNFTETANRNYMTQSAVSHHIKALEHKLGRILLERGRKQIRLTREGEITLEAANEILDRYKKLESDLRHVGEELSGTIRIAAILSIGLHELPAHVNAFLKEHPKVDIKFSYLRSNDVYRDVANGRADIGFVAFPKPYSRLRVTVFKQDDLVAIVPPEHRWAHRKSIRLDRMSGESFITLHDEFPTRKEIDRILVRAGAQVKVTHIFDNLESIKQAVESGLGVSIVPRGIVQREAQNKTLKMLDLVEGPFLYPIGLLQLNRQKPSRCVQAFIGQ